MITINTVHFENKTSAGKSFREACQIKNRLPAITWAVVGAMPRPASELIANALRTQDVIVSGTVAVNVSPPFDLH